jgi:nicotinate phosphoribosyltransferase
VVHRKEDLQADFEAGLRNGSVREVGGNFEEMRFDQWGNPAWVPVERPTQDLAVAPPIGHCDPAFFEWLKSVDCSDLKVYALPEGTVAFPRTPLIRVEGPLAIAQLQETTFLNLVNFPSLITTNAVRFRLAAGPDKGLIEFGLRRAQGPDGGVSASRYSYFGGFNGTSNVMAGQLFGLPTRGTMAHSYISSFSGLDEIGDVRLAGRDGKEHDFVDLVLHYRRHLGYTKTNEGELAAFISYARAFSDGFLGLVDTYSTLDSGVPNFICVALALIHLGYTPVGIRLDSGDLAWLSKEARGMFKRTGETFFIEGFVNLTIMASSDIDESVLLSLTREGHEIDVFGIGTHLVTCRAQPALGCVYKLVAINGRPRIKVSDDVTKMTIPGRKEVYRLLGDERRPLLDLMTETEGFVPGAGERILCRHPFLEGKRVFVVPREVVPLLRCVWEGYRTYAFPTPDMVRKYVLNQIFAMRPDHLKAVDPTPYKVSVCEDLYRSIHQMWMREAPITEIS